MLPKTKPVVSPLRLIISAAISEPCLACPVCGEPFVHPRDCAVQMNRTSVLCHGDDADVTRSTAGSPDRGTRITVGFWGECGHQFEYSLWHHKGITYVDLQNVVTVEPDQSPPCMWMG